MDIHRNHRDLVVWQRAITLAGKVYSAARRLPSEEQQHLDSCLRRIAAAIPSNIAEGAARGSCMEFTRFLVAARGNLSELETQLMIAIGQGYLEQSDPALTLLTEVRKLVNGLIFNLADRTRMAHARACAPELIGSAKDPAIERGVQTDRP